MYIGGCPPACDEAGSMSIRPSGSAATCVRRCCSVWRTCLLRLSTCLGRPCWARPDRPPRALVGGDVDVMAALDEAASADGRRQPRALRSAQVRHAVMSRRCTQRSGLAATTFARPGEAGARGSRPQMSSCDSLSSQAFVREPPVRAVRECRRTRLPLSGRCASERTRKGALYRMALRRRGIRDSDRGWDRGARRAAPRAGWSR